MSDTKTKDYNLAVEITDLVEKYKYPYDYIEIQFILKDRRTNWQNTYFLKNGKLVNGGKK